MRFVRELDLLGNALHLREQVVGVFSGALAAGDLFAGAIALGLQALGCGDALAPFAVERAKRVEIDLRAAIGGHSLEVGQMLAEIVEIMHG